MTKATATNTPVTVQVPLFNEAHVCQRAVDAACALRWSNLEVQILDDSTDETSDLVAAAVARHRAAGIDVVHVQRAHRDGFKAGALQHGLDLARGDYLAIFDADFVPDPDFLERMMPSLEGEGAALGADLAQARWGHINRDASWLTRAQAALLDAHFAVEQQGRAVRGRFFGFNGTAGIWRKAAIENAGGWDGQTLTEDLDLSLRVWLKGARFVYRDDVVVSAELPESLAALRVQQHRWAKGAMQTARIRLADLWRSSLSLVEKADITLKLTQNFTFVLLGLVVLALPIAVIDRAAGGAALADVEVFVVALGSLPALVSVVWALWSCGRRPWSALRDGLLGLGLAAALSLHGALAAVAGALGLGSNAFRRTPKTGGRRLPRLRARMQPLVLLEGALGGLHLAAAVVLCAAGLVERTPFLVLCGGALFLVAGRSLHEAVSLRSTQRLLPLVSTGSVLSSAHSQNEPS